VSESTCAIDDTITAVERALANPSALSATRRAVAADLFHDPGTATARCAEALYEAIALDVRAGLKARPLHPQVPGRRAVPDQPPRVGHGLHSVPERHPDAGHGLQTVPDGR